MNNTNENMTNMAIEEEDEIINPQAVPLSEEFDVAVDDQNCPIIKETYDPSKANGPFYQHSSDVAEQAINNGADVQLVQANIENRQDVLAGAMDPMKIATTIQNVIDCFMNSGLVSWFAINKENSINEIVKNVDKYNEFLEYLYNTVYNMRVAMSEIGVSEFMQISDNLDSIYSVMSTANTNNETYYAILLVMYGACGQIAQYTDNEMYRQITMQIMNYIGSFINGNAAIVNNDNDKPASNNNTESAAPVVANKHKSTQSRRSSVVTTNSKPATYTKKTMADAYYERHCIGGSTTINNTDESVDTHENTSIAHSPNNSNETISRKNTGYTIGARLGSINITNRMYA